MPDTRPLGGSEVSALGFGCWAIGGPFGSPGQPSGWGEVDDAESVAALRRGLELGVTLFDTADVYGTGHSEEILGSVVAADRDRVAIATKFGNTFEEGTGVKTGTDLSAAYIRRACEASLRRLGTDRIDVYQCHVGELERGVAEDVAATLEALRTEGVIRGYGVSVDTTEHVEGWLGAPGNVSVQHRLNVLEDAPEMLALCERHGLASLNRSPLAMGLLSGKFSEGARLPDDDVRASGAGWLTAFDAEGRPRAEWLQALASIRECLTDGGRTLVQGALAWIWARSPVTIPIPGFKTVAQAEENAGALAYDPLPDARMREIDELLGRRPPAVSEADREAWLAAVTIGPLEFLDGPVRLQEYDARWPEQFAREEERIRGALGDAVLRLEHVGSTSVPGLVAKPRIDILLVVADAADEPRYVPALEAAGYILRIREPDWHEHRLFNRPDAEVNLHVFGPGSPEIERLLRLRDRLRSDTADRERYAVAKRDLAARHWRHMQDYADAKSDVIEAILARSARDRAG